MELKGFKVGQVWRRRDGGTARVEIVAEGWPISCGISGFYVPDGRHSHFRSPLLDRPNPALDLVELVQDVEEPPTQTRLDAQLAGAMQASRGATAAELALFDAIVVAAMAPGCTNVNEYIYSALQLRRKLEQDISQ